MIPQEFIIFSILLQFASGFSYMRATWVGEAKPHRVTWLMWGVAPLIAAIAQFEAGVGWPASITFVTGVLPLIIFTLSFRGEHQAWQVKPIDYVCGAVSVLALAAWGMTKNPFYAVMLSMLSDFMASFPSLSKAYTHPHTEDGKAYAISMVSIGFAFLTFDDFGVLTVAFPAYLFLICFAFCVLIYGQGLWVKWGTRRR